MRFNIKKSAIVENGYYISDKEGKFTFPTTIDGSDLIMYQKALNELDEKYIDEFSLRETLQLEVQRLEEENKLLRESIKRQQSSNNECSKLVHALNDENQMFREIISQILYEMRMDHTRKEASIMVWVPYSKYQILEDIFKNKGRFYEND